MDVSGVSAAGASGTDLSSALRVPEGRKGQLLATLENVAQSGDMIAVTLRQLSDLAPLGFLIERPLSAENAAQLEVLLRASISAAADGNLQRALVKLAEFAELDPRRAETLTSESDLASIRPEVEQLLFRLASAALLNAESRLGQATRLLEAGGPNSQRSEPGLSSPRAEEGRNLFRLGSVPDLEAESRLGQATHVLEAVGLRESLGKEFTLQTAVLIAGRLLEAGGYANCMCSAALSQMAINQFGFAPSPGLPSQADTKSTPIASADADLDLRRKWLPRIKKLWLRAPLLVLLLAWLAIGLVAGSISAILRNYWPPKGVEPSVSWGFEVWGVGFLALVGFGFYARVRDKR